MRRADREITDFTIMLDIMKQCDCCRLGFIDNDSTYIVPLNFGYQADDQKLTLYFHGADTGKKMTLLQTQGCVGFEMDTKHALVEHETACGYSYLYQSIIGKGNISLVKERTEKIAALQRIMQHYSHASAWQFNDALVDRTAVIRLEVIEWSCKAH